MTHIEMTVSKILIPIVLAAATLMASATTPYSTLSLIHISEPTRPY